MKLYREASWFGETPHARIPVVEIEAVPVPWCETHDLPMDEGTRCSAGSDTECALQDPPQVFRIRGSE